MARGGTAHPPANRLRKPRVNTEILRRGPAGALPAARTAAALAFVAGGALLVWSGYIHFHLWRNGGYRHIATIGPLFLVQSVTGALLGLLIVAVRRVWAAVLGVGFAAATMIGFFITVDHGLFGFRETSSAPFAHLALILEIATMVVLITAGALCLVGSAPSTRTGATPPKVPSMGA